MTSRHRREGSGFDIEAHSPNGKAEKNEATTETPPASRGADGVVGLGGRQGKIEVSPTAIAHIASRAAQSSYGVVGLVPRHSRPGWVDLLRGEEAHRGVDVSFPDDRVLIELYVVIEYGTRISEVARNMMSGVKFAVESALGVPVVQVNVNIQDIRISNSGSKSEPKKKE
jgi:uncharacterized alkaline shock family protein YloU